MAQAPLMSKLASTFSPNVTKDILNLAGESVRLIPNKSTPGQPATGTSHLGGQPDFPQGTNWPLFKGLPMSFVAQFNLEELSKVGPAAQLPHWGLLSFFYDSRQETYGANPGDRGGWRVLFLESDPSKFQTCPFPQDLPKEAQFSPMLVGFKLETTLPVDPTQYVAHLEWSKEDIQQYENFLSTYPTKEDRASIHHRMFGYPDQIQDDMELEAALASHGITNSDSPQAAGIAEAKVNWELLLQVDSDEKLGMQWGSAGMIYYWIEKEALQARQFDLAWLVLQSD